MRFARQPLFPSPIRSAAVLRGPHLARAVGGKSFAAKRIHHAIETTGSCMLLAAFVVLFLFG